MPWPEVTDAHRAAVSRVLDSGCFVEGHEVPALEEELCEWTGAEHCVAVSSGTAAIELALTAAGVTAASTVRVPALTFSGSALPVLHLGAGIEWVDVDPDTFTASLPAGGVNLPVHLGGVPARFAADAVTVEDCCQAIGTTMNGRHVGLEGLAGCFSLNQTKMLWGGEGGFIITTDASIADELRAMRRFGERPPPGAVRTYEVTGPGWNAKLPEITAALARVNLPLVAGWADRSRAVVDAVAPVFLEHGWKIPQPPAGARVAWQKYRVTPPAGLRDLVISQAEANLAWRSPFCRWQHLALPEHVGIAPSVFGYPVAEAAVRETVVFGPEWGPIWQMNQRVADNLDSYLKRLENHFAYRP